MRASGNSAGWWGKAYMRFLLIILLLVIISRILASSHNPQAIRLGLKRLGLVAAFVAAGLGGIAGYSQQPTLASTAGAAIIGFAVMHVAMTILIWIISGFMAR